MEQPIVKITDASYGYTRRRVLEDVNLEILPRDFIAMIGPNGGGKTTLLNMIGGIGRPSQGRVLVDDEDNTYIASFGTR